MNIFKQIRLHGTVGPVPWCKLHFAWLPRNLSVCVNGSWSDLNRWAWLRLVERVDTLWLETYFMEITDENIEKFYARKP